MVRIMDLFKVLLIVQLFYAFSITALSYSLPADSLTYVTGFSEVGDTIDLETVSGEVTESLDQQKDIPVIELGALVFYSGNILIDLLLNFALAIPQMLTLLVQGLLNLVGLDSELWVVVQIFASTVVMVMYVLGLIELLTGIRSGRLT